MTAKKNKQESAASVVKVVRNGHEQWRVASGGTIKNLTARRSSTTAMDEAMVIYGQALKRLANR
jgi:hypothetical protein